MNRKTTLVMVWDVEVTDDDLGMGADAPMDGTHLVVNVAHFVDDVLTDRGEDVYTLRNVTVWEADDFAKIAAMPPAHANALRKRKGKFA